MTLRLRPPVALPTDIREFTKWCRETQLEGIPVLPEYTVATLPSAVNNARGMIYVSDEAGGPTPAFSNGTSWLRTSDLAVVS